MIIGVPSIFAIESETEKAYERASVRALGFFLIHVGGRAYGVRSRNATLLANSFDAVQERLQNRGCHVAPFANAYSGGEIADAIRYAIYEPKETDELILDVPRSHLRQLISSNHLIWAPDGDAAFDDGSYVLQFDVRDQVRLIAYRLRPYNEDYRHDPSTLTDQWLSAAEFYDILARWHEAFNVEWAAAPKEK